MKQLLLLFAFVLTLTLHASAKIWRVNNTTGIQADFTTITAAVNAAAPGDTLYVEGSATQYSGATIDKQLTIIGPGYYLSDATNEKTQWNQNAAMVGHFVFAVGSAHSVVSGLNMNSYQYMNEQYITIERCIVQQIVFGSGANINCDHDTIRQCVVTGQITCQPNSGTPFSAQGEMVYNNIINAGISFNANLANTSVYFINNDFGNSANYICENCVFQNNIFNNPNFGAYGTSNYFANNIVSSTSVASDIAVGNNNQFSVAWNTILVAASPDINSPTVGLSHDGQFRLSPTSAAIGAGSINGVSIDCGAFGGVAPYVLSGMPNLPSIYALSVPEQVNDGTATINISLSSAAH